MDRQGNAGDGAPTCCGSGLILYASGWLDRIHEACAASPAPPAPRRQNLTLCSPMRFHGPPIMQGFQVSAPAGPLADSRLDNAEDGPPFLRNVEALQERHRREGRFEEIWKKNGVRWLEQDGVVFVPYDTISKYNLNQNRFCSDSSVLLLRILGSAALVLGVLAGIIALMLGADKVSSRSAVLSAGLWAATATGSGIAILTGAQRREESRLRDGIYRCGIYLFTDACVCVTRDSLGASLRYYPKAAVTHFKYVALGEKSPKRTYCFAEEGHRFSVSSEDVSALFEEWRNAPRVKVS